MQFLVVQAEKGLSNIIRENINCLPQRLGTNFSSLCIYSYAILQVLSGDCLGVFSLHLEHCRLMPEAGQQN